MNTSYASWYESIYPKLSGYGLWLRGNEPFTLGAGEFQERFYRILLVRLSTCRDTVHSFTLKILYGICVRLSDVYPDMAFLPPPQDAALFDAHGIPWMLGVTTKHGPRDFDCIALSNATVLEMINIPVLLKRSGIPVQKTKRMEDPAIPLILLGGSNALASGALFSEDPVVDGIFIGGDVERIQELFTLCKEGKKQGLTKRDILERLEEIPGFIQPDSPRHARVYHTREYACDLWPADAPPFSLQDNPGTGHVPITHGCPYTCNFCFESWGNKPSYAIPAHTVIQIALRQKASQGLDSIELYSFNFNMHPEIYTILWELAGLFDTIGLKSQRFDMLAQEPAMLKLLHLVGKTSLTCGLEGISERLRRYLHKNLSEQKLRRSLALILQSPMRELKIFLIVTGHEQKQDFEEFRNLMTFIAQTQAHLSRKIRIIFSLTPLVRFPWTPLEFEDGFSADLCKPIINTLVSIVRARGYECRKAAEVTDYWVSQILARPVDQRVYRSLLSVIEKTGFVYYDTIPVSFADAFNRFLAENGIASSELLSGFADTRSRPWHSIDSGVDRRMLRKRFEHGRSFIENNSRLLLHQTDDSAPSSFKTPQLLSVSEEKKNSLLRFQERIKGIHLQERKMKISVDLYQRARGVKRELVAAVIARAIFQASPDLTPFYRGLCGSLWDKNRNGCWIIGADCFTVKWLDEGYEKITRLVEDSDFIRNVNNHMEDWGRVIGKPHGNGSSYFFTFESAYPFSEAGYLKTKHIKFTRQKKKENEYQYCLTAESVKKKLINSLELMKLQNDSLLITLMPDNRFDPVEFAQKSFLFGDESDWIRIIISSKIKNSCLN